MTTTKDKSKEQQPFASSTCYALKSAVSEVLMNAVNGSDKSLRTDDGFIRWGLVEKRIHSLIDDAHNAKDNQPL